MMKYFYITFFLILSQSGFAQWSVSGAYPRTLPNQAQYTKNHIDTTTGRTFFFRHPKWFMRGEIIQSFTPTDSVYFVSSVGVVTVSFDSCQWYNTASQSYWKKYGGSWINTQGISLDSLLHRNNTWTGKNIFTDSLKADKGIKSGGLIDTKGVTTEGSSTLAALVRNGVESSKDTVVSSSYTITGAYGTVTYNCTSSDLIATLPPYVSTTENWILVVRKSGSTSQKLTIKDANNVTIYETTSNLSITVKNISTQWKRISVAMYQ